MELIRLTFLIFLGVQGSFSANILAVTTQASPSHHIWHRGYFLALVQNGHNVTVLTHDKEKENIANMTVLTFEGVYDKIHKDFIMENSVYNSPLDTILELADWDEILCTYDFENDATKVLLNYPKDYKFDLIIWDMNSGRCLYPLIDKFGTPPVIGTSPFGLQPYLGYIFGNHIFSYVPFYQVVFNPRTDFLSRLENFFYIHLANILRRYYSIPRDEAIARKYFGNGIRSIDEYERNVSLMLVNADSVLNYPEPIPSNIIPVGGMHIRPVKDIPKDLQSIVNDAKHGVIFVSFGTNLNFEKIGEAQRHSLIEAFRRLPQTILIKSPKVNVKFSANVVTRKWLPQNDILAHPNVKLFLTHGGALSAQEAVYHGIPVVGMSVFLDQHGNMAKIVKKQLGKNIDYFKATPELVYDTIVEVLNNPIYRKKMQEESRKSRDQPQTPLERALFWTEYTLRHGMVEHLSPASRDMTIFQRFDLDIALVLFSIFTIIIAFIFILLKYLVKLVKLVRNNRDHKVKKN